MLLCEKRKFLFIHIYKNAGTSIKKALRPHSMPAWHKHVNSVFKRIGWGRFGGFRLDGHLTSAEIIQRIGRDKFDSYFSFAIVRNPWDWEVSHYRFILQEKRHESHQLVKAMDGFGEYIRWRCDNHFRRQSDFLRVDQIQVVKYVGKFESLHDDFDQICRRIGVEARLPRRNTTLGRPYHEYYDRHTTQLVYRTYQEDVDRFGYEFD